MMKIMRRPVIMLITQRDANSYVVCYMLAGLGCLALFVIDGSRFLVRGGILSNDDGNKSIKSRRHGKSNKKGDATGSGLDKFQTSPPLQSVIMEYYQLYLQSKRLSLFHLFRYSKCRNGIRKATK